MVLTTIISIALLGAGPPPVGDWMYPGATDITRGSGSGSGQGGEGGGVSAHENLHITASTADDYAAVVKHFQGRAGTTLENGSADGIDVIDDSTGRPVKFKVIARRWCDTAITAVIFRADGETVTRFHLIDVSRFGRDRKLPSRPFDLRDWTYPDARVLEHDDGKPTYARARMTTRDDHAAVLKYYQEKTGAIARDGTPLASGSISSPDLEVDVAGGSSHRPIKHTTLTRWWREVTVTVVVTRSEAEEATHVDLIYRSGGSP